VGTRLRSLRQMHGLSQRELARRADMANGLISLIEQNRHSPSVATLRRVLDGFPISLAEFFALELPPRNQVFFAAHELLELTKGSISFRQVPGPGVVQILYERYEPLGDTGETMLRHEGEEGGVVIQGRIELTVGDQQRVLKAGESYYFNSRIPHRFRNPGKRICIIISACTPPWM